MVLREIKDDLRPAEGLRRRSFTDEQLDLYVWYDEQQNIVQFQLSYDRGVAEQAFTWSHPDKISHHAVDDGESGIFRMKSSPVLTSTTAFDKGRLLDLLNECGQKLEHDLFQFIAGIIERVE